MSSNSMPSKPIHFFDVPEVKKFDVDYRYNFFAPDESIDESGNEALNGNLSSRFLRKGTVDTANLNARIPRYVEFSFSLSDTVKPTLGSRRVRSSRFYMTSEEILDALNDGKIVTEDNASESRYASRCVSNSSLQNELENFMRLSLNQYTVDESSIQDAVKAFVKRSSVNSDYVSKKLVPPSLNEKPKKKRVKRFLRKESREKNQVQLNSSYAPMVLRKSVERGTSLYSQKLLDDYLEAIDTRRDSDDFYVTEQESVFDIEVISQERAPSSRFVAQSGIVGMVIEKKRVYKGKKYPMPAVVVAGPRPTRGYDTQVAYGQTYEYSVRTIAKFRVPATTDDGRTYIQTFLVASKPSQVKTVTLSEDRAPEPPQDVNYYYNYSDDNLHITWAPPVNPQRDVKYFQVFRRTSVREPFELIAHLDFDDSVVRNETDEYIEPGLITSYPTMPTYFIDDEFDRSSSYIYALVAVDARQISSVYSTQTLVSFDNSKNKIRKEFICYSGAPKQYPNWTLKENFFVDTMKDSNHSSVNIYFNPEAYTLIKGDGEVIPAFYPTSVDPLAKYVFQFINTDRLLEQKFEAVIDDSSFREDAAREQDLEKDDDE